MLRLGAKVQYVSETSLSPVTWSDFPSHGLRYRSELIEIQRLTHSKRYNDKTAKIMTLIHVPKPNIDY